jgi:hypothetical protein
MISPGLVTTRMNAIHDDDFDDEDEVAATDVAAMYAPRNNTTSLMITVLR